VTSPSEVRALLDARSDAIRAKDIDRLMSCFSPDVVYFDVVPPLRYGGSAELRARFRHWFDRWTGPIDQEISELSISASVDVATAFMLVRAGGTLVDGHEVGYWVRVTDGLRRSDQAWSITHEHVSLPVDLESGSAVMDLVP
jgi:ketosteroid isomerase-like protein